MPKRITVREWIEKFDNKEFEDKDVKVQCDAGWYDWFCRDTSLAGKTAKMGSIIRRITNPDILDNHYVFFKNCCPMVGGLYDRFSICDLIDGEVSFCINISSPYEDAKFSVFTPKDWETPSFEGNTAKELIAWLNGFDKNNNK